MMHEIMKLLRIIMYGMAVMANVIEAHCYVGSMNEMKLLSIERSKWTGNRAFWPCRPLSAVRLNN